MELAARILLSVSSEEKESTESGVSQNPLALLESVFPNFDNLVRGKRVCDFGCGYGLQASALASIGCEVVGVESNPDTLAIAKNNTKSVKLVPKVSDDMRGTFDVVISQNSMEHFPDPKSVLSEMMGLLKPDGRLLITFGPPWYAPWGSHMHFFCRLPWLNVWCPERVVMKARSYFRNDGACRYEECESGLNKMSLAKFESLIAPYLVESLNFRCVKGLDVISKVPVLRELFTNNVSAILKPR